MNWTWKGKLGSKWTGHGVADSGAEYTIRRIIGHGDSKTHWRISVGGKLYVATGTPEDVMAACERMEQQMQRGDD